MSDPISQAVAHSLRQRRRPGVFHVSQKFIQSIAPLSVDGVFCFFNPIRSSTSLLRVIYGHPRSILPIISKSNNFLYTPLPFLLKASFTEGSFSTLVVGYLLYIF